MAARAVQARASLLESGVPEELTDDTCTQPVSFRRQILVVDDVPANLLAVEAALAPLKRDIVTALSGREALARLLDTEFALVLLDVQMPDMDGYETAHWIRTRERTRHLPIIFLTAHNHDQHAVLRAYQLGVVDFLFKPIEPAVLRAKAEVFLSLQERTEQLASSRLQAVFELERRDQLARINQELADNDRRKNEFLAILAHELRNPMAPMRTALDLVKLAPERPLAPKLIDMLDRQLGMLSRLVEDLLDVSRITANKIELRPEPMDLRDAVALAVATSGPAIEARHHTLAIASPADPVPIVGDHVRIVQVVSNLLNNAARYTEPGGAIRIACGSLESERVFVEVSDTGVGIPSELLRSIFDMFVQERVRSDGSGGMGLGLALSRHLVELHRGTIHVASEGRGKGSTFRVEMPGATSPRALPVRRRTRDMAPLARTTSLRVVIVDDNEDARDLLATLLDAHGHQVQAAADGPGGLAMIREQQPDLALVDLGLPGMDGIELVRTLRAENPLLRTRLIAITGYGDPEHQQRAKAAGFDDHLVKPASVAAILAVLSAPETAAAAPQLAQADASASA